MMSCVMCGRYLCVSSLSSWGRIIHRADQEGGASSRSSHLKPLYTSLVVHRLKLSLSSQDASGAVPLGTVPTFTRRESLSEDTKWLGEVHSNSILVLPCLALSCLA
jgi:hypothetical protein